MNSSIKNALFLGNENIFPQNQSEKYLIFSFFYYTFSEELKNENR